MKVFVAALALFLVIASFSLTTAGPHQPTPCCYNYATTEQLRTYEHHLKSYFFTSCPQKSVVFITERNRATCADPEDNYVKELMGKLSPP